MYVHNPDGSWNRRNERKIGIYISRNGELPSPPSVSVRLLKFRKQPKFKWLPVLRKSLLLFQTYGNGANNEKKKDKKRSSNQFRTSSHEAPFSFGRDFHVQGIKPRFPCKRPRKSIGKKRRRKKKRRREKKREKERRIKLPEFEGCLLDQMVTAYIVSSSPSLVKRKERKKKGERVILNGFIRWMTRYFRKCVSSGRQRSGSEFVRPPRRAGNIHFRNSFSSYSGRRKKGEKRTISAPTVRPALVVLIIQQTPNEWASFPEAQRSASRQSNAPRLSWHI